MVDPSFFFFALQELDNLKSVRKLMPNEGSMIPTIVSTGLVVDGSMAGLVLSPVGYQFAPVGTSATRVLQRRPKNFSPSSAADYQFITVVRQDLVQLLLLLRSLHAQNLVHRDVKPSNFFAYVDKVTWNHDSNITLLRTTDPSF